MDYDERIAKVEALVDTTKKDIDRLYDAVERLKQHIDTSLSELRQHTDKGLAELRLHTANGLAELRASLDAQRKETSANMRWMVGLTLVNTSMILGLSGRIFGVY
jgi:ElaB/YqjD/DUF883 family membrane-anchored ribosome-binding protein